MTSLEAIAQILSTQSSAGEDSGCCFEQAQGHHQYGSEVVSQLDHALQCATLAEAHGTKELVTACLLHDLGHLYPPATLGIDDRHEYRSLSVLKLLFPPAVTEPIRLHVEAKRYLCAVDPHYWSTLSPASQQSLIRQGGIFSAEAAAVFIAQPYAQDAVKLRIWDDQAKVPNLPTPNLAHFMPLVQSCQ